MYEKLKTEKNLKKPWTLVGEISSSADTGGTLSKCPSLQESVIAEDSVKQL